MDELQQVRLYNMAALEDLMGVERHTIMRFIDAGLLHARKIGHGWKCSGKEIAEFYERTAGLDLGNPNKIILAAQQVRNEKSASRTRA